MMGKSRSTSFVIAYLMKNMSMDFESAYKLVKSSRRCAFPNLGFIRQLRDYEKLINNEK
jgi:protein-tyrosine phosphatase